VSVATHDEKGVVVADDALLIPTFVALADTLVDDFDLMDLLDLLTERCVELFSVSAAGIILRNANERLELVAASDETMHRLELLELQTDEGPCIDCYRSGIAVPAQILAGALERWPLFAPVALRAGFQAAQALPMRLRGITIGALNLYSRDEDGLSADDLTTAQAMADVATIAILQHRAAVSAQALNEQLQEALNSRIVIEQAKGVLAERAAVGVDAAFTALRSHARRHGLRLTEVARGVIAGTVEIEPGPRARSD